MKLSSVMIEICKLLNSAFPWYILNVVPFEPIARFYNVKNRIKTIKWNFPTVLFLNRYLFLSILWIALFRLLSLSL